MMNKEEKLDHVLSELKRVALPDERTDKGEYWGMVECLCDNAVDHICDTDNFVKGLIKFIEADDEQ